MDQKEFEIAKEKKSINNLLNSLIHLESELNAPEATAYNFLIDYLEHPEWFSSTEGQRLLLLSLEVLGEI
jgi:hypothetical protein